MTDDGAPDREEVIVGTPLELVNIVEVFTICCLVTGGALTATAVLIGRTLDGDLSGQLQFAVGGIGGFLLGVTILTRWVLGQYT